MALIIENKDGSVTEIDGKTGGILAVKADPADLVEVESLTDHQNIQGAFCPGAKKDSPGARYFETRVRAMDLVHRGIVKLIEAKPDVQPEPEIKMSEPEGAAVAAPVAAGKKKK